MKKSSSKAMLAVLLLAQLLSMAPVQARQLLRQHGADSTAAVAEDGTSIPAAITAATPELNAAVLPAAEAAAAAADMPASPDNDVTGQHAAAVAAVTFNNASTNSVHVSLEDQFKCFCQPGELLWGCPFFPRADLQNNVKSFLGCLRLTNNWPRRACGKVRNSDCSTTLVASKTVVTDFNVTYKFKKACPGCCTAFGIHAGGIDKGVDDILEGLAACSSISWGYYKFQAPTSELHVTETQFNEPCYGVLRTMTLPTGKARARIHAHSFRGSSDTWTICVGASTSAADSFIGNMNAALSSRGVADVVVEKKGVGACYDSPGKEGRDELGLEIKRGLALNMAADASTYKCGKDTPTASAFAAFVDALQWTFPGCTASNQASTGTNSLPSCTVGCKPSGTRKC